MTCEISKTGECTRPADEKYHCEDCDKFIFLAQGALLGGGYILKSSRPDQKAAVYDGDGNLLMEINKGRFRKGRVVNSSKNT